MPFVKVHIIENTFTLEQKKAVITNLTNAMVAIEGEPFRPVTWVVIEEIKEGSFGIAGQALHASDVKRLKESARA